MRATKILAVGLCLGLTGCLLPTPLSIATSGFDAVSFVATGKSVTDHGISLAVGEDCAMMRVLEGGLCREAVDYEMVAPDLALEPLPSADSELLVAAHPEVVAAAQRGAAFEGWSEEPSAALGAAVFVAAGIRPDSLASGVSRSLVAPAPGAAERSDLASAVPPAPPASPLAGASFLADASFSPAGWSPRAVATDDPVLLAALPDESAPDPADDMARLAALESAFGTGAEVRPAMAVTAGRGLVRAAPRTVFDNRNSREVGARPQVVRYGVLRDRVVVGSAEERLKRSRRGSELDG